MALLVLILYIRIHVVRLFVCANCVRVYTIERAYARAYTYMRMHLYPREFVFVYTHKCKCSFLRAYARVCAQNISTLKRTLGSETLKMYYTSTPVPESGTGKLENNPCRCTEWTRSWHETVHSVQCPFNLPIQLLFNARSPPFFF